MPLRYGELSGNDRTQALVAVVEDLEQPLGHCDEHDCSTAIRAAVQVGNNRLDLPHLAYNVLCGGTRLEDNNRLRHDVSDMTMPGADVIPDPMTAGDFRRRFDEQAVTGLMEWINAVRSELWRRQYKEIMDPITYIYADGTIVGTYTEQEAGMQMSYNGIWGYAPLIISLAHAKLVGLAQEKEECAWKCFQRREKQTPLTPTTRKRYQVSENERIAIEREYLNHEEIAEFSYRPGKCKRDYRVVALRTIGNSTRFDSGLIVDAESSCSPKMGSRLPRAAWL